MIYKVLQKLDNILIFINNWVFLLIARLLRAPATFVIGDSHTGIFKRSFPFIAYHIGPATAHGLNKERSTTNSKRKIEKILHNISANDTVILLFGEIDCRIHVYNQFRKNNERIGMTEIIHHVLDNYFVGVEKIMSRSPRVHVCGVPPAGRQENIFDYPYFGDENIRSEINRIFNGELAKRCKDHNISFIDLHSSFSNDKGMMLRQYTDDDIHLNRKALPIIRSLLKREQMNRVA